jgi:hypothetical protein
MVKMFGWESFIYNRISEKREEELFYIRRARILEVAGKLLR